MFHFNTIDDKELVEDVKTEEHDFNKDLSDLTYVSTGIIIGELLCESKEVWCKYAT